MADIIKEVMDRLLGKSDSSKALDEDVHGNPPRDVHGNPTPRDVHGNPPRDVHGNPS